MITALLLALCALPSFAYEKEQMEDCTTKASTIHPGMTRAEIESRMTRDGGIMGIFKWERLYFASPKENFCMLTIDFRPHGVSDATFNDVNKFGQWVRENGYHPNPQDEAVRVSAPFIKSAAAD